MAINVSTLAPASEKAKNVATETYVDSAVAAVDVSGDIADNNELFAQKLGYASYSAMVAAAASGNTVINGGYINTGLIQANGVLANDIMSKDITFTGKITGGSGGLGGIIKSYNNKMTIDLVNGSIYIA